jgi:hypothetical protein
VTTLRSSASRNAWTLLSLRPADGARRAELLFAVRRLRVAAAFDRDPPDFDLDELAFDLEPLLADLELPELAAIATS